MQKKMIFIPVAILFVGFIIMMLLFSFRKEPPSAAQNEQVKMVQTKLVRLSDVTSYISGYGRVTSAQPVVLISEVNGTLVPGTVPFRPAQDFKKGDVLIKVDERQIRLDLNSTKSDLLNALSTVLPEIKVDFPDEYIKWQKYFNDINYNASLAPMPEVQNQKIKLFLSRFNVYKLYFQIRNLEIQLEKHFFIAPFNGSVISADLHAGSTVRIGSRLGEIINLDELEIEVPLPVQDVEWIDREKPIKFTSSEMTGTWYGKVKRIGKNIDTRTQTIQVFMSVQNSQKSDLFNGVFLEADIPGRTINNAVSVPRKLIYEDQYVYLVHNQKLQYRKVDIARRELDSVIIRGGLADNDTLVSEVMQGVAPGMLAQAVLMDQD